MFGTPVFMAPEQILGDLQSPATDVYGLGMLLYQMVYGKTPFHADSIPLLMHRMRTEPVSFPDAPAINRRFKYFISRCLEKTANQRPDDPFLLKELHRLEALLSVETAEGRLSIQPAWRQLAVVGGGLAAIAVASTFVLLPSSPTIRQVSTDLILMLVGAFLWLGARRWLRSRRVAVIDEASQILTGIRDRDVLPIRLSSRPGYRPVRSARPVRTPGAPRQAPRGQRDRGDGHQTRFRALCRRDRDSDDRTDVAPRGCAWSSRGVMGVRRRRSTSAERACHGQTDLGAEAVRSKAWHSAESGPASASG